MMKDFEEFKQGKQFGAQLWQQFWEGEFEKSLAMTTKRAGEVQEDYDQIFRNEMYVTELLMNIMAYYE